MTWTWALAVASIIGVILNIHQRRVCFVVWLCTNVTWAVVDFAHGLPAQGALFAVYAALAAWGWWAWKPERRRGQVCHGCMHLRASDDVSAQPRQDVGTDGDDADIPRETVAARRIRLHDERREALEAADRERA